MALMFSGPSLPQKISRRKPAWFAAVQHIFPAFAAT